MNKTSRVLWLIFAILLIAVGVGCIVWPDATLLSLAWLIGVLMIAEGVCSIAAYSALRLMPGSGWLLFDGILTILIAVFLLANDLITAAALPYVFGMWAVVTGIQRIILACDLHRAGVPKWGWLLAVSIACTALGVLTFVNPLFGEVAISVTVGWLLLCYGISAVVVWIDVGSARRYLKDRFQN